MSAILSFSLTTTLLHLNPFLTYFVFPLSRRPFLLYLFLHPSLSFLLFSPPCRPHMDDCKRMEALSAASDAVSDMDLAGASLRVRYASTAQHNTRHSLLLVDLLGRSHLHFSLSSYRSFSHYFSLFIPFPPPFLHFFPLPSLSSLPPKPPGRGPALGAAARPSRLLAPSGVHNIRIPGVPCIPAGESQRSTALPALSLPSHPFHPNSHSRPTTAPPPPVSSALQE